MRTWAGTNASSLVRSGSNESLVLAEIHLATRNLLPLAALIKAIRERDQSQRTTTTREQNQSKDLHHVTVEEAAGNAAERQSGRETTHLRENETKIERDREREERDLIAGG